MSFNYRLWFGALGLSFLAGCSGGIGGTETGNANPTGIGFAVGDSIDTVTGMLDDTPDFGNAGLFLENPSSFFAKLGRMALPCAYAGSPCVEIAECNDVLHTATFVKDFSGGCDVGDGFTVEGKRHISWFNMGPNSCTSPTSKPTFINAIQGEGARQIRSTDVIPPEGNCGQPQSPISYAFDDGSRLEITQCGTLDYLNFVSPAPGEGTVTEEMNLAAARRIFFRPNGSALYDHSLLTPQPMLVDLTKVPGQNRPNKVIHSGSLRVVHNLAKFTVDTEYQEVEWDYNECRCFPVRGTVAFTVTNDVTGETQGSGSVIFNKEETGACRLVQATFQGQELTVPLHNCRGN